MRTIHFWKAKDGWHWHAKAKGRIVETGAEAYSSRRAVIRAIQSKLRASYVVVSI